MPQAIPAIVSAIAYVGSAASAVATFSATAAQIATVVAVGVGAGLAADATAKLMSPRVGSSSATIDWKANPNAPIPFPYGRFGTAGTIVHYRVYGQDDRYVSAVSVIGGGRIKSFLQFRANETFITFDGAGKAVSSAYANVMWLTTRLGTQTDTALASPTGLDRSVTLPDWGSAYTLPGFACTMWTLAENSKQSAYEGRVPVPLNVGEGMYCYDPRFDSTYPGGSGSCRLNDPATWPYTQNPIIHALDWVIGRWNGMGGVPYLGYHVGGIGAKPSGIHFASFVQAANLNDLNGWKGAGVPDSSMGKDQVLDAFLKAGGAQYAEFGGKIGCVHRAGPRASVITLTGRDLAGPVEVDSSKDPLDRINTLQPRFWSEAAKWEMVATDEVTSSVWQIEDGQGVTEKRTRGIDYDYVPAAKQARELATLQVANEREGITVRGPLRPYIDLEPGNCVVFDEPDFVLNGIKFIVLEAEDSFGSDTLNVVLESETDPKYAYAFGQADAPPPTTELVPFNPDIPAPDPSEWSLTAETFTDGGVSIPALVFTGDVDNALAEAVIFDYRPVDTPPRQWSPWGIEAANVVRKEVAGPLTNGTIYEGAVSYRVGGRIGDRLVLGPVTAGQLSTGGGGPQAGSKAFTGGIGFSAPLTTVVTTDAITVPATGKFALDITAFAFSDLSGSSPLAIGTLRLFIVKGGTETEIGSVSVSASSDIEQAQNLTTITGDVAHAYAGPVAFRLKTQGGGPATSSSGTITGRIGAVWYAT